MIPVLHNPENRRFEAESDGHRAILEYRLRDRQILFTHTEVPTAIAGRGVAGSLVRAALEHAREQKLEIVPLCKFVAAYIRRHPEYLPLVDEQHRKRLERSSAQQPTD